MNKYKWEQKRNGEVLDFFKKFIKWIGRGRVKVIHFGWWHIGKGRFGLSMYWETED